MYVPPTRTHASSQKVLFCACTAPMHTGHSTRGQHHQCMQCLRYPDSSCCSEHPLQGLGDSDRTCGLHHSCCWLIASSKLLTSAAWRWTSSRQLDAHGVPFMALACGHRLAPQRPCGLVFAACPKENQRAVRARVASDEYCRARVLLLPHTFPARSETCMSDKLGCMSATVCMSVTTSRQRPCRASVC